MPCLILFVLCSPFLNIFDKQKPICEEQKNGLVFLLITRMLSVPTQREIYLPNLSVFDHFAVQKWWFYLTFSNQIFTKPLLFCSEMVIKTLLASVSVALTFFLRFSGKNANLTLKKSRNLKSRNPTPALGVSFSLRILY